MFHIFSPPFLPFCSDFPNVKNSNCFHHGSTDVCKHTGKGKTFTPMNSSSAKIHESVARLLRQPIHGCGCGTQTHLFSVATKVIIWCQVSFLSYPERNATATRKKPLWWDCFLYIVTQLENKPLTSSKNTVPADPTPAVDSNLFLKDDGYWKLRQKFTTSITT